MRIAVSMFSLMKQAWDACFIGPNFRKVCSVYLEVNILMAATWGGVNVDQLKRWLCWLQSGLWLFGCMFIVFFLKTCHNRGVWKTLRLIKWSTISIYQVGTSWNSSDRRCLFAPFWANFDSNLDLNKTDHLLRSISLEFVCQFSNPRKAGFEWLSPMICQFGKSNEIADVLDTCAVNVYNFYGRFRTILFPDPFGESS